MSCTEKQKHTHTRTHKIQFYNLKKELIRSTKDNSQPNILKKRKKKKTKTYSKTYEPHSSLSTNLSLAIISLSRILLNKKKV